jgi:hypothetical protein
MTDSSANENKTATTNGKELASERRIRTYQDLLEEEQRLIMQVKRDKARVADDIAAVKNIFMPAGQAINYVSNMFTKARQPGVVSQGLDVALDLVSKKYLFRRSNWLVTLAGSYLVRGVSQVLLNMRKKKEPDWLRQKHNGIDA